MQLTVGNLICVVFVVVKPVAFSLACQSLILHNVSQLLLMDNMNIGAKTRAAASFLGPAWLGCVLGGAVVSLARAAQ